jgi:PIN domain nuclease of toxin-antitoxin system
MRLLLDTHALIWAVDDPSQLGARATSAMEDQTNELLLSAAAIWELSIKVGLGKLTLSLPYLEWMNRAISDMALAVLPITAEFADAQMKLPFRHGDPFDRLMAGQAQTEQLTIISSDLIFDRYAITRLW